MDQFMKLMRDEHRIFTDKDDNEMMQLIMTTHSQNCQMVDVEPLLELIKDILNLFTTTTITTTTNIAVVGNAMESLKRKTSAATFEALVKTIHEISCKISCKCTGEKDNTMSSLIKTLASYSWDAKVLLVLAAFAVTYRGFFLLGVVDVNKSKPLEKLRILIEAMETVIECVVNVCKLPRQKSLDQSVVQTSVYWTFRSVLACGPQIFGFLGLGYEYTLSRIEDEDLSKIWNKLNESHGYLKEQLQSFTRYHEEKIIFEYYQELVQIFSIIPTDNIEILNAVLNTKYGLKPLFQVTSQKMFGVEELEKKNVLLLISADLNIYREEIGILVDLYKNTKQVSQYELVCLPLGKTEQSKRDDFVDMLMKKKMPWYLVHHEHVINLAVFKYIREVWHFNNKPILVVLDPQGRIISHNAFPRIKVWGGIDLSITIKTEVQLWTQATWGLQLLFQTIDRGTNIIQWINEKRFICLYGGEDINWIRNFTRKARAVAKKANIQLEMVYMGARYQTKRVENNFALIQKEKLSDCWPDLASKFWVRLEGMWQSRMETTSSIKNDEIMMGITSMLTFDGSENGWALISRGTKIEVKAKGDVFLNYFERYDFMDVIKYVKEQDTELHCNRLILPLTVGKIPEEMPCPCEKCPRLMEKFVMYRCCND
ncbi:protein SIEVE ELEMENT OCCLUSION A-like [Macadamia integrifolia]|uniref:protein SIEVE ELEMENT OCCLUSION A-like n=1 Tax=Macadamia integrifolia TaxID=60698 RepID=UPI001C4F15FE|nr:protein SIEVE ELEMENT OCCLUSION A-like [Macadamia integrifolia]